MRKESGVLFLFILIVSFVSASHSASNVYLNLNGQNIDLQSAIDAGNFTRSYTGGDYSGDIIFGHKASEIIINVNGTVKNLSSALSDGSFMKATSGKSPANYTGYNFIYGEYASNISVIINGVEKNLQEAVNQSNFYVCVPNCVSKSCGDNGCGGSCGICAEGYSCNSSFICAPFTECYYSIDSPLSTFCKVSGNAAGIFQGPMLKSPTGTINDSFILCAATTYAGVCMWNMAYVWKGSTVYYQYYNVGRKTDIYIDKRGKFNYFMNGSWSGYGTSCATAQLCRTPI